MSILNVNQIQPVGSGQTVTISATNIDAGSATVTAGTFSGGVTVTSGNLTGITSVSTSNLTVNGNSYPNAGPLSNRNLVINGAMVISQRGTSFTNVTTAGYRIDQFKFDGLLFGTWTIEQSTDAPDGFSTSYKATCTTAAASPGSGDILYLQHLIEAQNLQHLGFGSSAAQSLTLSFWVKSNKTGTNQVSLYQYDSSRIIASSYTINAADTWEYKTFTFAGDTSGQIDNNNQAGIAIWWPLLTGSTYTGGSIPTSWETYSTSDFNVSNINYADATSNYFAVTGVQLEVGSVATPFEHRSYGDELARCRRYYYKIQAKASNTSGFFANAHNRSTTSALGVTQFPVEMRTTPTALEQSGTASDYSVNHGNTNTACSSVPTWFEADTFAARTNFTTAGSLTDGQGSILRSASTDAYLAWSAEL